MKALNAKWILGLSTALLISFPQARLGAQAVQPMATSAVSAAVGSGSPASPTTAAVQPRLVIDGGDLLEVNVFDTPEMAQVVRVSDQGDATFSLIGRLHVADLTTDQARELIAQKLREGNFMLNPQISVLIREYATQGVSILGEVTHPGVYQVLGTRSLIDLLAEAGGTTPEAGPFATVKRHSDGTEFNVPVSRNAKTSLTTDLDLQPGDKVLIPRANLIYVIGDVNRPGAFLMENDGRLSALQALAYAGGNTRTAALNRVVLVRKDGAGAGAGYTRREISLKNMMHAHQADLQLQADDILFVPNSTVKSVVYKGLPDVVQAAASASIYASVP